MDAGTVTEEDTEAEDMVVVVAVVVAVVAKEGLGEGAIIITHMNSPAGKEHSWQKTMYTIQTNGDSSPSKKHHNIKEMKICEVWRGFEVPLEGYKLENEGKPVVDQ